jgi:lipoprotein-anchoring transpeptidase ErfK/SrfK
MGMAAQPSPGSPGAMDSTLISLRRIRSRSSQAGRCLHADRRGLLGPIALCLISLTAVAPALAAAGPMRVRATQQLVVLMTTHRAHSAPLAGSPQAALVPDRRPITGERTILPVIGRATGPGRVRWLHVMLPGRPDGSTGWIAQQGTRQLTTSWHIVVDLARRVVQVYDGGRLVSGYRAVVGDPSTPTPTGQFFVEETVQMPGGEAGGPYALALSARSNALQEFEGGPGQIAIHGRDNLGGVLGTASSHGCIRLNTASIDWLAARIGPGTPTTIE